MFRKKKMKDIIALYENYTIYPDNNMGYVFKLNECYYVMTNGKTGSLREDEAMEKADNIERVNRKDNSWTQYSSYKYPKESMIYVRNDYKEMFEKLRKPGRAYKAIMQRMAKELA